MFEVTSKQLCFTNKVSFLFLDISASEANISSNQINSNQSPRKEFLKTFDTFKVSIGWPRKKAIVFKREDSLATSTELSIRMTLAKASPPVTWTIPDCDKISTPATV